MICVISSFAMGKITNFAQTNKINSIQTSDGKLVVFTGGGVYTLDLKSGRYNSEFGSIEFPDPNMTASCIDDDGTIWVGSSNGYLNSWDPKKLKWNRLVNSYQSAGWKITAMIPYGPYLIIGSSKGLSVFDKSEKRAKKNAGKFSDYTATNVNALAISKDRLYVGLDEGVVYIDNISTKLNSYNFFDPAIWKTDSSRSGSAETFLTINDSLFVFSQPAVVYDGKLLQVKSDSSLVFGDQLLFQTPDTITCLKTIGSDCWIGTKKDCLYKYSGSETKHFKFEGPTFPDVYALSVGSNGHVFVVPKPSLAGGQWWRGIQEYTGSSWKIYNSSTPNIGGMPENNLVQKAIIKSREGDIWIGTAGAHCKRYTQKDNSWSQYCTYSRNGSQGLSSCGPVCPANDWAKSDAIAQDSSGFIWAGCWQNPDGTLICFDPANKPDPTAQVGTPQAHYRRFFDSGQYNAKNVTLLCVDMFGTIFVGNEEPDKLFLMKHDGDPVSQGVNIIKTFSSSDIENGKFKDAVSSSNGLTYILVTKGLFEYNPNGQTLVKRDDISNPGEAIELEDDNILWYASPSDGLVRYDLLNKERLSTFTKVDGLVSTSVQDLSLDRANGIMWIATDQGVTRLSIGVKSQLPDIKKVAVFPVPFRKSWNKTINFHYVSPNADITVYSLHGSLVGKPIKTLNNSYQAQFAWTVPANVSPGTYYYIIKDGESSAKGRLLITP
jgi:ligand-binding sensor domain-containing protein